MLRTRKTDELTKRKLYERFGVREYWVVDPELKSIKLYRWIEQTFVRVAKLGVEHDDVLKTPLLPGFSVALAEIFASPIQRRLGPFQRRDRNGRHLLHGQVMLTRGSEDPWPG